MRISVLTQRISISSRNSPTTLMRKRATVGFATRNPDVEGAPAARVTGGGVSTTEAIFRGLLRVRAECQHFATTVEHGPRPGAEKGPRLTSPRGVFSGGRGSRRASVPNLPLVGKVAPERSEGGC